MHRPTHILAIVSKRCDSCTFGNLISNIPAIVNNIYGAAKADIGR